MLDTDQRVVLRDLDWERFVAVSDARGETPQPRLHYLDGVLELLHSSREHEFTRKTLSRCLETWSEVAGVRLEACGSYTLMNRRRRCAAEADDWYFVGRAPRGAPDLAVERRFDDGEIDQLELFHRLGVREVWLWDERRIRRHELVRGGVLRRPPLSLFERCLRTGNQTRALRMLRRALKH